MLMYTVKEKPKLTFVGGKARAIKDVSMFSNNALSLKAFDFIFE
jgi:hypothetical protein